MKPSKSYAEHLEASALEQYASAMAQPFVVQGALMPDAHFGYSLPIGAVVATKGVIVPAWVGYDIGCGMCALPTTFNAEEVEERAKDIFQAVYRAIPTGFKTRRNPLFTTLNPNDLAPLGRAAFDKRGQFHALGTLGGGNHFIEIGKDETDKVWIIIHSGSRGVGHGVATNYMRLASPDNRVREGHYGFATDSAEGREYFNDLNWALQFALQNRTEMAKRVVGVLTEFDVMGEADWDELINRNHNHAEFAHGMWIHRKGATHAEKGMLGVIPGNMKDGSFIVQGKGCPEALWSSSHGAGRVMSRKQAKRELGTKEFVKTMKGITAKVGDSTLDESPLAYKDIYEVMRLQQDLVEVVAHVKPTINVKG